VNELKSILIVDDSAQMRRTIRLVVKDLVSEIYECSDGSDALAAYSAHHPDWVLMDIRMKKTDGFTAIKQIKAMYPDARIAVVTISTGEDLREAARSAGASAFVVKDNLLELRKILINGSAGKRSWTSGKPAP
jgi:two-component system chemotaxis response regulator CheY